MPASPASSEDTRKLTSPTSRRKKTPGRVLQFTRHKSALARLVSWEVPAAARFILHVLLATADDEGVSIVKTQTILDLMPRSARCTRYTLRTLERMLVLLRAMGLLSWTRIKPLGWYPRCGALPPRKTSSGGRVWQLNLPVLRGTAPPLSLVGTVLAGSDLQIGSGYDLQIGSSDPLDSPSESLLIPATATRAAVATGERDRAPFGGQVASETPSGAPEVPKAPAPPAQREPPAPPRPAARARPTPPPTPPPDPRRRERLERERAAPAEPDREPTARVKAADVAALLASLDARHPAPRR
jgi:hypothetical protein